MYDIAICDDDAAFTASFQEQLSRALADKGAQCAISVYSSPEALRQAVESGRQYRMLFLDVLFAETQQGIALAGALRRQGCDADIVFVSTCPDYAVASFDTAPLYYLVKPVQEEKLSAALSRFLNKNAPYLLRFDTNRGYLQVPLAEVAFFEIFVREIVIHKTSGQKETCVGTLKELENRLPANTFVRPHRSYLVNLDQISEIARYMIRVSTGETVPVSQKLYPQVQQAIIRHADQRTVQF